MVSYTRNYRKGVNTEDTTIVSMRIPISMLKKIDYYAQIAKKSRNAFIIQAVSEKIERMRQELSQNHMEEWE
jgi:metal-responsive CopG/Arc/MetJ family transcriptional regulator